MVDTNILNVSRRHVRASAVLVGVLAITICVCLGVVAVAHGVALPSAITVREPRLVVLKSQRIAHLFDGDQLIRSYPIDLGFSPDGQKMCMADGRTPVGRFRVATKNPESPYHRFLGINYPHEDAVRLGLRSGLITQGEAVRIRAALSAGRCPDWTTALGGGIGIHGHRLGRDWTAGCVAVADRHIEELFSVLRVGDPIEILP